MLTGWFEPYEVRRQEEKRRVLPIARLTLEMVGLVAGNVPTPPQFVSPLANAQEEAVWCDLQCFWCETLLAFFFNIVRMVGGFK